MSKSRGTNDQLPQPEIALHLDTLTYGGEALGRYTGQTIFLFPHTHHIETVALLLQLNRAIL